MVARNSNLNASNFTYSQTRKYAEFELLLTKCIDVYRIISTSQTQLCNNENSIRDEFLKFLQCKEFKETHELRYLKFDAETIENTGKSRHSYFTY